jgi:regulatory protein
MSDRDSRRDRSATAAALRLLARRPLSRAEVGTRLERQGHGPGEIEAACERLDELGYLDDARLAFDFIVTRSARLSHGPAKLVEALCRRGVERPVAIAALERARAEGELEDVELLRRRLRRHLRDPRGPLDRRDYARVYNALLRAGFDPEAIRRELDSYRGPASHDRPTTDETIDDFA